MNYLPIVILISLTSTIITPVNTIIASYMVGEEAVSAITSGSLLTIVLSAIATVLSVGGSVVFMRYIAKGKKDKAGSVFTLMVILAVIAGGLVSLYCLFTAPDGNSTVADYQSVFFFTSGISAIPIILLQIVVMHMWIDKDGHLSLLCFFVYVISDIIIAVFLLGDEHLYGIFLSATIASILALCVSLLHRRLPDRYMRFRNPKIALQSPKFLWTMSSRVAVNRLSMILRYAFLYTFISSSANYDMLCLTAQTTVLHFVIAFFSASAIICNVMCGWCNSEGDRFGAMSSVRATLKVSLVISIVLMAAVLLLSEPLADLLTKSMDNQESSLQCLRWFALSIPTTTACVTLFYAYMSTGRRLLASCFIVFRGVIAMMISVIVISNINGPMSIWTSFIICDVMTLILILLVATVQKGKVPRNLSELIYKDPKPTFPVYQKTLFKGDAEQFLKELPDTLESICSSDENADVVEYVQGMLLHIESLNRDYSLRLVVRYDDGVTVIVHDDCDEDTDIPEGTTYYRIIGINSYSKKFATS